VPHASPTRAGTCTDPEPPHTKQWGLIRPRAGSHDRQAVCRDPYAYTGSRPRSAATGSSTSDSRYFCCAVRRANNSSAPSFPAIGASADGHPQGGNAVHYLMRMEPAEVNANHLARLPGERMSLDGRSHGSPGVPSVSRRVDALMR
jgi:hypothetical protein